MSRETLEIQNLLKVLLCPSSQNDDDVKQLQSKHSDELQALVQFCSKYKTHRKFNQLENCSSFVNILSALAEHRIMNSDWRIHASLTHVLQVLVCLRILLRDPVNQRKLEQIDGVSGFCKFQAYFTQEYLAKDSSSVLVDILKEITNIHCKLLASAGAGGRYVELLISHGTHSNLIMLLSATDIGLLHLVLRMLINLSRNWSPVLNGNRLLQNYFHSEPLQQLQRRVQARSVIASVGSAVEKIICILQDYDVSSKELAAQLLRYLAVETEARDVIKLYGGISLLLSLLQSDSLRLVWNIVWCLILLSSDSDISNDIRLLGGLPILLSMLHDTKFVSFGTSANVDKKNKASVDAGDLTETVGDLSLKAACCSCLTELVINDANTHQVVQNNGIYQLALLILPPQIDASSASRKHYDALVNLQANAFRCLRFLFSFERTRRHFKRLLPSDIFESFIDIGHYNRDIAAYIALAKTVNSLPTEIISEIQSNVENGNQNQATTRVIGEYEITEVLGSGAFGTVYKVRKQAGQSYLAMKELNTLSALWGHNSRERQTSIGDAINELSIIREQLKHPNIVKYYKTFMSDEKLYIVMELIDGVTLAEHITSLKEKKETFTESQIWKICIQLILALRYLHKEKGIVHRDLTPNNVMLDECGKVTVTDFGLAKQKRADCSKMNSVVGTILCSCPELIQNLPYGEKADIWGLGCLLYQMCALNPPFYSSNMLTLANKIVNADYDVSPLKDFSPLISTAVRICLTPKEAQRPDIVGVAAHIADVLLLRLDSVQQESVQLEKKLERACKRSQKHVNVVSACMAKYHSLNQETPEAQSVSSQGVFFAARSDSVNSLVIEGDRSSSPCQLPVGINVPNSDKLVPRRPITLSVPSTQLGQSFTSGCSPGTPMLSISPGRMRQINDPVLQILQQVHHLIFLSQLPPTVHHSSQRRLVDYFKRSLFLPCTTATNLKNQLHKLATGSRDVLELPSDIVSNLLVQISQERGLKAIHTKAGEDYELEMVADVGLTYEQLRSIIDGLLTESGYYQCQQQSVSGVSVVR